MKFKNKQKKTFFTTDFSKILKWEWTSEQISNPRWEYDIILNTSEDLRIASEVHSVMSSPLIILRVQFIDLLHETTGLKFLRALYIRSLTRNQRWRKTYLKRLLGVALARWTTVRVILKTTEFLRKFCGCKHCCLGLKWTVTVQIKLKNDLYIPEPLWYKASW